MNMKRNIDALAYAGTICTTLKKGVLLTSAVGEKVNPMTISWGTIGIQWGKPIFVAFVRENRFTRGLLDESGEFTVSIPVDGCDSRILSICGTKSGRDMDKVKELGLTVEPPVCNSVPGFAELPLTLECKVLYQQKQDISCLPEDLQQRYYPQDVDYTAPGSNRDAHIAYYGEIVSAYIIEK